MELKKFIPCIYLYKEKAVSSLSDDTMIDNDPVSLAVYYMNSGADEIIIYDRSEGDEDHEKALDVIRDICAKTDIPVTGAGNVSRMEDIKKLIYAGCSKACLNYSKPGNIGLTKEVSEKFGRDKIMACVSEASQIADNSAAAEEYLSGMILVNARSIPEEVYSSKVPMTVSIPEVSLDKIMEMLEADGIEGISGNAVNDNIKDLQTIKLMCKNNGIKVTTFEPAFAWNDFKKNSDGLIPVVVQENKTGEVLMVAYMNEESYNRTIETGMMTYYSRSRKELWVKGETSGHYQYVKSLTADCDLDTILARVSQIGAACHTGSHSCFFNEIASRKAAGAASPLQVLEHVYGTIADRKANPKEGSYTNYLFDKGIDKILKKVGEESTEIVIAAKNPNANEVKYEISDFLYHMMVLMVEKNVTWEDITEELTRREAK